MMADKKDRSTAFAKQGMLVGETVHEQLARQFGIPILSELPPDKIAKEIARQIPYAFAKKNVVLPIEKREDSVVVAIADPLHLSPIEELAFMLHARIETVYTPRELILAAIHDCFNTKDGAASEMIATLSEKGKDDQSEEPEVYDLLEETAGQAPTIKLLNLILTEAIQQGASDIHFEPNETGMRVRYRIDGVLQNRHTPAPEYQAPLVTRIKVMAKLDIAEHRLPQDGRIKLKLGRREIDFRVSTVPISHGERIVLRILDRGNVLLGMEAIGMPAEIQQELHRLIHLSEGIVLVTGPTGSGKTTTLYSALSQRNSDDVNIMTVEDPVEYNLAGIAQIGVRPQIHLTFARGLRHILRQDPDVVMIGEIRDQETAEIAIQAALTGHLVLSTLHTNDAPSAITRLVDMEIEPYLLSSTIVGVLAQRLVRRICPDCREAYAPSEAESRSLGIPLDALYRGRGCPSCFGCGYKGRQGIYELLTVNHLIKQQIVRSPDAVALRRLAISQGMKSLFQHGLQLIRDGVTTLSEVLRVSRGIEEEPHALV